MGEELQGTFLHPDRCLLLVSQLRDTDVQAECLQHKPASCLNHLTFPGMFWSLLQESRSWDGKDEIRVAEIMPQT